MTPDLCARLTDKYRFVYRLWWGAVHTDYIPHLRQRVLERKERQREGLLQAGMPECEVERIEREIQREGIVT